METFSKDYEAACSSFCPPEPVDSAFVTRVKANLRQADREARELALSLSPASRKHARSQKESAAKAPKRENQGYKSGTGGNGRRRGPRPLQGNCKGCNFPKSEYTRDCKTCYFRHRDRFRKHSIPIPARITRLEFIKPAGSTHLKIKPTRNRARKLDEGTVRDLYEIYKLGISIPQIMEDRWRIYGYKTSQSASAALNAEFHRYSFPLLRHSFDSQNQWSRRSQELS